MARGLAIATALLAAACTSTGDTAGTAAGDVRTTGVIVSIDTQPWTYDGNAVVQVDTADRGRLQVQLPARWNLCRAAPVDVEAMAVGMRVEVEGAASGEDAVVVCADASHGLVPAAGT
ncbi:hypothetical protein ACF3M1_09905 [Luteimonas sp. WGS1318]|uniref:hypothetical protein n=1 Tax=Luteimonas sp. WGS1318 TaxID=3366815 RepID=UPI00372D0451